MEITKNDVKIEDVMFDDVTGNYIYYCKKDTKKDYIVRGFTNDGVKALLNTITGKWFFGQSSNQAYLIPLSHRTLEERQEIGRLGIKKTQERKAEKKNLQEIARSMLEQTASEDMIKAVLGDNTETMMDSTFGSLLIAKGLLSALEGSYRWAEWVRDTSGQRPKNEMEISADIITDSDKALLDKLTEKIG